MTSTESLCGVCWPALCVYRTRTPTSAVAGIANAACANGLGREPHAHVSEVPPPTRLTLRRRGPGVVRAVASLPGRGDLCEMRACVGDHRVVAVGFTGDHRVRVAVLARPDQHRRQTDRAWVVVEPERDLEVTEQGFTTCDGQRRSHFTPQGSGVRSPQAGCVDGAPGASDCQVRPRLPLPATPEEKP